MNLPTAMGCIKPNAAEQAAWRSMAERLPWSSTTYRDRGLFCHVLSPAIGSIDEARMPRRERRSPAGSRCQFVLDTQNGPDTSFQVPRDTPHPSFGRQSLLDGSDPGRIAILQPPAAETDPLFLGSRKPSEHPLERRGTFSPRNSFD